MPLKTVTFILIIFRQWLIKETACSPGFLISKIEVEIGTMAGIDPDALQFAWEVAVQGTMAEQSNLVIHTIQAEAHCLECGTDFPAENFLIQCPNCSSYRYQITKGKELRISSLMVD